jgi:hypothetical protein
MYRKVCDIASIAMTTVVQKDYKSQMDPAPPSDQQRLDQWNAKVAKVAGDFFEGPAKRFLEEWDPKQSDRTALIRLAESVQHAMSNYLQASR